MIFHKTVLEGVYIVDIELKTDDRGYFARAFCKDEFQKQGLGFDIAQANRSFTKIKGTIRGMHFQKEPKAEDKIVLCVRGSVYDVVIDLRHNSPTYRKHLAIELSEDNKKMLYIPKGFAHGFQTLTDNCELFYFMSQYYASEYATGVRWNDPIFNIIWPLKNLTLSEQDKTWPKLQ